MVAWMTILGLLSVSWTIPSTLLSFLIYKYIWSKPPGHQSLLDLVIAEYLILSITRNIITVVYHCIGLLHGPIDPNVANFRLTAHVQLTLGTQTLQALNIFSVTFTLGTTATK